MSEDMGELFRQAMQAEDSYEALEALSTIGGAPPDQQTVGTYSRSIYSFATSLVNSDIPDEDKKDILANALGHMAMMAGAMGCGQSLCVAMSLAWHETVGEVEGGRAHVDAEILAEGILDYIQDLYDEHAENEDEDEDDDEEDEE